MKGTLIQSIVIAIFTVFFMTINKNFDAKGFILICLLGLILNAVNEIAYKKKG